jgi:hypothetical protein
MKYKVGDNVKVIAKDGLLGKHGFDIGSTVRVARYSEHWSTYNRINVYECASDRGLKYFLHEGEMSPATIENPDLRKFL